jgi:hypothetical protein
MSDEFIKDIPPIALPVEESREWARHAGWLAGYLGHPPAPPPAFAIYAADWRAGWQSAAVRGGWAELMRGNDGDLV